MRFLIALLLALPAAKAGAQFGEEKPASPQEGLYRITKIILEDWLLGAEHEQTKVYFSAGFTYDPLPGVGAKKEGNGKNGKRGKNGKNGRKKGDKSAKEDPPKFVPSKDCKAWMVHVNWTPRLGDKMKLADAGDCRLKGSFAGR